MKLFSFLLISTSHIGVAQLKKRLAQKRLRPQNNKIWESLKKSWLLAPNVPFRTGSEFIKLCLVTAFDVMKVPHLMLWTFLIPDLQKSSFYNCIDENQPKSRGPWHSIREKKKHIVINEKKITKRY